MTTQIFAILKKEFRQQYPLAVAMLLLCFIAQLGAFIMISFRELFGHNFFDDNHPMFFGIALLTTVLYAGAAAAVSFSVEHEEKTFGFLRNLPVSPLAILLGKTAWVVTGTIFVFINSLILTIFWRLTVFLSEKMIPFARADFVSETMAQFGETDIWLSVGVGIIEVLVWGFFWSSLCHKQIHAVLAAYSSASLTSFFAIQFSVQGTGVLNAYGEAVPLRLGIIVVVGIVAVCSMLRWFKRATRQNSTAGIFQNKNIAFLYPDIFVNPFFALLCQSVWQSLILLVFCFIATVILCLPVICFSYDSHNNPIPIVPLCCFVFTVAIGGGCTFGADQRNQSFRFLSRCGILPGKIWWSRVLPFFIVSLPFIIVATVIELVYLVPRIGGIIWYNNEFAFILSGIISLLLIPFSVGTFCSIYCRSMIVSVALTSIVSILLFFWMLLGWTLFRFNPFWTTLPLAVALLVASRLRTADWLREQQTWKSLLKPLIPFFATITIIIFAVPFVQVYSIPYISLNEVEDMLNKTNIAERLSPEERKKMFQETSARLTQKFNKEDIDQIENWHKSIRLYNDCLRINSYLFNYAYPPFDIKGLSDGALKKSLKKEYTDLKETIQLFPRFETWILYNYEMKTRIVNNEHALPPFTEKEKAVLTRCRYLPWQKARMLRIFNWQLGYCIRRSCIDIISQIPHDNIKEYFDNRDLRFDNRDLKIERFLIDCGVLNFLPDEWLSQHNYFQTVNGNRLRLVYTALRLWYLEHDRTLPKSLDELVGTYLDEIPRDPLIGTVMEYNPNGNFRPGNSEYYKRYDSQQKIDCPYLKLGNTVLEL
ncbi:MAG: hypothetical protein LBK82_07340 [Planctomycetaceae bacterium]|jgi:hypothetical protein|nr:hypothetical protein [Planctomycetaceae bacterium]